MGLNNQAPEAIPTTASEAQHRLSYNEYIDMYDLEDAETFKQQGEQLNLLEELMTLMGVALRISGCQSFDEYNDRLRIMSQEGAHFRHFIQQRAQDQ